MLRRDFIKAISAAAAAAFGGVTFASPAPAVRRPQPPAKPEDTLDWIRRIIRTECRIVSVNRMEIVKGGICVITVSYRHDPKGVPSNLDAEWSQYLSDAAIRSVEAVSHADSVDMWEMGLRTSVPAMPVTDIVVEYVK